MKINKLKINSYGKLKNKEIELKENINLIYGKNESGKSTLLKFIINSFYGISKNKKGREHSDLEKYTPWVGEEFSGKLEYELDNSEKFEIYREFRKKNPKIFNEKMEDISKEFNIDKNKGNEFFYEQTSVDEELFLSTIVTNQQEVRLEKNEQNILIQKIANLVGTGDDNVSYKRAIERINRRQLDEVGTSRSREKPINILNKEIEDLENEKVELEKYEDLKYGIEEKKIKLEKEITNFEDENNFLKEIKIISEKENLEKEKIKIKENIKKENDEKIKLIKNKIDEIKNNNKNILEKKSEKNKKIKNKTNKKILLIFILLIIINILQFILIKNNIFKYIFLLTVPTFLIFLIIYLKNKNKKIKKEEKIEKNNLEKIKLEINNLNSEINLLEKNNLELEKEIEKLKSEFNLKINLEKEKIKNKYLNKIEKNKIEKINNYENINLEIEKLQNKINDKKIELHQLQLDKKNIEPKLENLSKIEEKLVNDNEKMVNLKNLNKSIEIAKNTLNECYEKMKSTVTPRFTQNLSDNISEITDRKYSNVMFNDEQGLIVELEDGSYVSATKLSIGTIDQLYLSLRLSMVEDLSSEKMPIILDEAFAYFDDERLENILRFISEKFSEHQIIILTCTNREKKILEKLGISFNLLSL